MPDTPKPLDEHVCNFCQHLYLDVMAGYCCRKKNISIAYIDVFKSNDCTDWFSAWMSDFRAHKGDKPSNPEL